MRTAKGKGKGIDKGNGKKGKGGNGDANKGGFRGKRYWCEEMRHRASECNKKTSEAKARTRSIKLKKTTRSETTNQKKKLTWEHSTCVLWNMSRKVRKQKHDEQNHEDASNRTDASNRAETVRRDHGESEGVGQATQ